MIVTTKQQALEQLERLKRNELYSLNKKLLDTDALVQGKGRRTKHADLLNNFRNHYDEHKAQIDEELTILNERSETPLDEKDFHELYQIQKLLYPVTYLRKGKGVTKQVLVGKINDQRELISEEDFQNVISGKATLTEHPDVVAQFEEAKATEKAAAKEAKKAEKEAAKTHKPFQIILATIDVINDAVDDITTRGSSTQVEGEYISYTQFKIADVQIERVMLMKPDVQFENIVSRGFYFKDETGPLIYSKGIAEQADAEYVKMLGDDDAEEGSIPYRGLRTKGPLNIQTIPNDNFNLFYCVRSKQTRLIEDHHSIWRHVISGGIKQLLKIIIDEIGFCPNYFITMIYKAWLNNPELKVYAYMDANQNCAVEDAPVDYTTSLAVRRMCGDFVELEYREGCARYGLALQKKLDSFIRTKKFDYRSDYVESWWNVLEARLEEHLNDEKSAVYQKVKEVGVEGGIEITLIGKLKGDQYQIDRIERMMILKDVRLNGEFNINRMHNLECDQEEAKQWRDST